MSIGIALGLIAIGLVTGTITSLVGAGGGIIGSRFANKIDERRLKQIVSILFVVIGVLMVALQFIHTK